MKYITETDARGFVTTNVPGKLYEPKKEGSNNECTCSTGGEQDEHPCPYADMSEPTDFRCTCCEFCEGQCSDSI